MFAVKSRARLYLSLYEVYSPACRRYKSFTSAIKYGMRAEDSSNGRRAPRERSDRPSRGPPSRQEEGRRSGTGFRNQDRPYSRPSATNATRGFDSPRNQDWTSDRPSGFNRSQDRKPGDREVRRPRFNDSGANTEKNERRTYPRERTSFRSNGSEGNAEKSERRPYPRERNSFGSNGRDVNAEKSERRPYSRESNSFRSNGRDAERYGATPKPRKYSDEVTTGMNERRASSPARRPSPSYGERVERPAAARIQRPSAEASRPEPAPSSPKKPDNDDDNIPESIPYTTAASVFLYGQNSVLAALRGKRRKGYKLHLATFVSDNESTSVNEMITLARKAGVGIKQRVSPRQLDQMTAISTPGGESRPHNGVVLEASQLPAPPTQALSKPDLKTRTVAITLGSQSAELAAVNGTPATLSFPSHRNPFVLFVDGILDPGNLGNIMRTAHFYNVDAIAVATNTCAPLSSAVLAKASAGACEAIPIFALPQPANFIFSCRKAGWEIYAAAPAPSNPKTASAPVDSSRLRTTPDLQSNSPLLTEPCILMMGAEGEGLRSSLAVKADYFVSIEQAEQEKGAMDVGVESLNVAVATGVLLEGFMRGVEINRNKTLPEEERVF